MHFTKSKAIAFFVLIFCSRQVWCQQSYVGIWKGELHVGQVLPVYFHIKDTTGNRLSGTMDSPNQLVYDKECDSAVVRRDSLIITYFDGKGTYRGMLVSSDSIAGVLSQSGKNVRLGLKRTDKGPVLNRPQTPKPPFGYISENVTYQNADHSITYGATITIPNGKGKHPALLLITGSGQQNRDEEIMEHKPFAVLADYLTKRGYIVLRVDDRGIGQTTGDFASATTLDFANDARASLHYLRSRKEVDTKKIGLAGHSEGGLIAPMIAATDKNIDFIILLAGPGEKITQLMDEQGRMLMEKSYIAPEAIDSFSKLYNQMQQSVITAADTAQMHRELISEVRNWTKHTPRSVVFATTRISNDTQAVAFADAIFKSLSAPWYRYFLSYDPAPNLEKLSCKVLALNGEKDIQVASKANLDGIRKALAKSKSKHYDVIELPGLNHLFQHCKTCTVKEYGQIEETFSPDALTVIGDWLDKYVK